MEFNFNSFGNSKQTISYCEVDKCKAVIKYKQAVEKVREIAKEHVPRCDIPSYECNYECDCEMCHYRDLSQILRICDEVNDV